LAGRASVSHFIPSVWDKLSLRHWFYDDFLRPLNPSLPPLSQKHFTKLLIASSPLYSSIVDETGRPIDYDSTWEKYTQYKRMVPTCGVALINVKESKVSYLTKTGADEIDITCTTLWRESMELA
jgi:hypothetical protein